MLTEEDKLWIVERLEKVQERFEERLAKVETTLLTELQKLASPDELRQKTHAAVKFGGKGMMKEFA